MTLSTKKTQQFPKGLRVLVVVHDIAILTFILEICNQCHYQVATCSTAYLVWNLLKETSDCFDIILIDAQMPDLNSSGFLEYVTQQLQIKIPIILMSDDESQSATTKAFQNGADEFWGKPLDENRIKYMWHLVEKKKIKNEKKQDGCVGEQSEVRKVLKKKRRDNLENTTNGCVGKKDNISIQTTDRLRWSRELHELFENVVKQLRLAGIEATPKRIVEQMNVLGLTKSQVSSHLQKWRDSDRSSEGVPKHGRKKSKHISNETQPASRSEQSLNVPPDSLIQWDDNVHAEHNHDQNTNTVVKVSEEAPEFPDLSPLVSLPLNLDVQDVHSMQEEQNFIDSPYSFNRYNNGYLPNMFSADLDSEQQDNLLQDLLDGGCIWQSNDLWQ